MKLLFIAALFCAALFADSLDQIRQNGVIRIGVRDAHPPLCESNGGKFEGFEIDLANAIAKEIFGKKEGKIEFIPLSVNDRIPFLEANKLDLVIGLFSITNERKRKIDFSLPYLSVNLGVLTRKADALTDIAQLHDKKIVFEGDATVAERFFKNKGFKNLGHCASAKECYEMIRNGDADGYINDNLIVLAYSVIDDTLEVPFKNLGPSDFIGIGVQKDNKELLDFVNAELIKLSKEGFFKKAYEQSFDPFYRGTADKKYFLLDGIYNML
ncbi:transporter substrate-binding domain-containing protein [uncultured Campylobacter sp.]|uniref:transporter substrate-binding domain-containing protein n=1 Tax=uncultured Campylobacter sp. TaxID=218934 RepID=UPI0026173C19|nr:transporter substrate-binding domain-containing protein [uncultured Campylobacter sp.]